MAFRALDKEEFTRKYVGDRDVSTRKVEQAYKAYIDEINALNASEALAAANGNMPKAVELLQAQGPQEPQTQAPDPSAGLSLRDRVGMAPGGGDLPPPRQTGIELGSEEGRRQIGNFAEIAIPLAAGAVNPPAGLAAKFGIPAARGAASLAGSFIGKGTSNEIKGRPATEGMIEEGALEMLGQAVPAIAGRGASAVGRGFRQFFTGPAPGEARVPILTKRPSLSERPEGESLLEKARSFLFDEGRTVDIPPETREAINAAIENEIPLGLETNVSPRAAARLFTKIAGRFPLIGKVNKQRSFKRVRSIRRAIEGKVAKIQGGRRELASEGEFNTSLGKLVEIDEDAISDFAPVHFFDQGDLSVGLVNRAKRVWKGFRSSANSRYAAAAAAAEEEGAQVPLTRIKNAMSEISEQLDKVPKKEVVRSEPILDNLGDPLRIGRTIARQQVTERVPIRGDAGKLTRKVLKELEGMDDVVSVEEYRGLMHILRAEIQKATRDGADIKFLTQLQDEASAAVQDIVGSPKTIESLAEANRYFHDGMTLFERRASRVIDKARPGIFDLGKAPDQASFSLKDSEVLREMFQSPDPGELADLRRLVLGEGVGGHRGSVGANLWKNIQASYVDEAIWGMGKDIVVDGRTVRPLNVEGVIDYFGLGGGRNTRKRKALDVMLRGSGVTSNEVDELMKGINLAMSSLPESTVQFMIRRASIGGPQAFISSFSPGSSIGGGAVVGGALAAANAVAAGAMVMFGANKFGRFISDPRVVRSAITAMSPTASAVRKDRALRRLAIRIESMQAVGAANESVGDPIGGALGTAGDALSNFLATATERPQGR